MSSRYLRSAAVYIGNCCPMNAQRILLAARRRRIAPRIKIRRMCGSSERTLPCLMDHFPDEITFAVLDERPWLPSTESRVGRVQPPVKVGRRDDFEQRLHQADSLSDLRADRSREFLMPQGKTCLLAKRKKERYCPLCRPGGDGGKGRLAGFRCHHPATPSGVPSGTPSHFGHGSGGCSRPGSFHRPATIRAPSGSKCRGQRPGEDAS
jgi:hypothetical protein